MIGMPKRGKLLALSTAAVGVVVLVVMITAGKDRIAEVWQIHILETGRLEEAAATARALGQRRSVRAVDPLVKTMARFVREGQSTPDLFFIGPATIQPGSEVEELPSGCERLEFIKALHDMGPRTLPGLLELMQDSDGMTRRLAACALVMELGSSPFGTWAHCPCQEIRETASWLERIHGNTSSPP
jgi:hypothetical protein